MTTRDIIVVGTSAGGVTALKELVRSLPGDFAASIFVVMHIPAYSISELPSILRNAGPLEAVHPKDGEGIEPGKIYVAPNDHHLLLEEDQVIVKEDRKKTGSALPLMRCSVQQPMCTDNG